MLANIGRQICDAQYASAASKFPVARSLTLTVGCLPGALSGLLTAATGVFVMPMVPYLQALRLAKEVLIQALGLSFTVATLAQAI